MTTSSPIQPFRVWLRRGSLDRSLAAGEDPHAILRERRLLLQLAADLESDDELQPRGIA